jgi:hypothetical protein
LARVCFCGHATLLSDMNISGEVIRCFVFVQCLYLFVYVKQHSTLPEIIGTNTTNVYFVHGGKYKDQMHSMKHGRNM